MDTRQRKAVQEDSDGSSGEREREAAERKRRSQTGKEQGDVGDRINVVSCRQAQLQTSQVSTAVRKICSALLQENGMYSPSAHTHSPARTKWSVWHHKDNVLFHSQQRADTNSCRISAFQANLAIHTVKLILTLFSISTALSIFKSQCNTAHCTAVGTRQVESALESTEH